MSLSAAVRSYWEQEPCGTSEWIVGPAPVQSPEWFSRVERHRYQQEPHIFAVAQFTRWAGKKLLEVGVGAGCDHLQFARAGAECHGVDLTDAAIETTRQHLALHGLQSHLQRADAERLPFADSTFDVTYSWGVIHHAANPAAAINEVYRTLKPGGTFIGMLYGRHSLVSYKLWLRRALLAGKPFRTLENVLWHHMESPGTKAYTAKEVKRLFRSFQSLRLTRVATLYDRKWLGPMAAMVPDALGWNLCIQAVR